MKLKVSVLIALIVVALTLFLKRGANDSKKLERLQSMESVAITTTEKSAEQQDSIHRELTLWAKQGVDDVKTVISKFNQDDLSSLDQQKLLRVAGRTGSLAVIKSLLNQPLDNHKHKALIESTAYNDNPEARKLGQQVLEKIIRQGNFSTVLSHLSLPQHFGMSLSQWSQSFCRFKNNHLQFEVLKRSLVKHNILRKNKISPSQLCSEES